MAEIINLRQARKRKARADKDVRASENRIAFGRSKEEKRLSEAQKALETRRIDGHKREDETS